jgi:hypothetical protein
MVSGAMGIISSIYNYREVKILCQSKKFIFLIAFGGDNPRVFRVSTDYDYHKYNNSQFSLFNRKDAEYQYCFDGDSDDVYIIHKYSRLYVNKTIFKIAINTYPELFYV